jgi:hypothetical protein
MSDHTFPNPTLVRIDTDPVTWIVVEPKQVLSTTHSFTSFDNDLLPQSPFPSWVWDDGWKPPIPKPSGDLWNWNEEQQQWDELEIPTEN